MGRKPEANPGPDVQKSHMRRDDLGEPASDGDARYHREGALRRCGGARGKVTVLIRGGLSGRRRVAAGVSETACPTWQESAEVVVPTLGVFGVGKDRTSG